VSVNLEHQKIVALLFRRIGDSLMATPALRAIRKRFPDHLLSVITEPQTARIFELNPAIDEIFIADKSPSPLQLSRLIKQNGRPEIVLDFLSDPRTALACLLSGAHVRVGFKTSFRSLVYHHRVPLQDQLHPVHSAKHKLELAMAIGSKTESLETEFYLTENDIQFASDWQRRTSIHDATRLIAIFPFSRREYKRWQPDRYISLCKKLQAIPDFFPVLISGPGEADYCSMIAAAANLDERHSIVFSDLGEMAAFLKLSSLYVSNDGGPKHLAAAMQTPTVTIFLNDPPEYWTPPNSSLHIALASNDTAGISVDTVLNAIHTQVERCG